MSVLVEDEAPVVHDAGLLAAEDAARLIPGGSVAEALLRRLQDDADRPVRRPRERVQVRRHLEGGPVERHARVAVEGVPLHRRLRDRLAVLRDPVVDGGPRARRIRPRFDLGAVVQALHGVVGAPEPTGLAVHRVVRRSRAHELERARLHVDPPPVARAVQDGERAGAGLLDRARSPERRGEHDVVFARIDRERNRVRGDHEVEFAREGGGSGKRARLEGDAVARVAGGGTVRRHVPPRRVEVEATRADVEKTAVQRHVRPGVCEECRGGRAVTRQGAEGNLRRPDRPTRLPEGCRCGRGVNRPVRIPPVPHEDDSVFRRRKGTALDREIHMARGRAVCPVGDVDLVRLDGPARQAKLLVRRPVRTRTVAKRELSCPDESPLHRIERRIRTEADLHLRRDGAAVLRERTRVEDKPPLSRARARKRVAVVEGDVRRTGERREQHGVLLQADEPLWKDLGPIRRAAEAQLQTPVSHLDVLRPGPLLLELHAVVGVPGARAIADRAPVVRRHVVGEIAVVRHREVGRAGDRVVERHGLLIGEQPCLVGSGRKMHVHGKVRGGSRQTVRAQTRRAERERRPRRRLRVRAPERRVGRQVREDEPRKGKVRRVRDRRRIAQLREVDDRHRIVARHRPAVPVLADGKIRRHRSCKRRHPAGKGPRHQGPRPHRRHSHFYVLHTPSFP